MDNERRTKMSAWATSRFSQDDLHRLRVLMRAQEQRLLALGGLVTAAAVMEAVYAELMTNPALLALAVAVRRASQRDLEGRKRRAAEN